MLTTRSPLPAACYVGMAAVLTRLANRFGPGQRRRGGAVLLGRSGLVMVAVALIFGLSPASPARAAVSPPRAINASSTAQTQIALHWDAVKAAPKYRIQYSTNSKMSKASYVRVVDNHYELGKLKPATRYYFRVRVITAAGKNLSNYSKTFSTKTAGATGYSHLPPRKLSATSFTSSSVSLRWDGRGSGVRYRVEYSTSPSGKDAVYRRYSPTKATITQLRPSTTYYFRVRVIDNDGGNLSGYSSSMKAKTAPAAPAPPVKPTPSVTPTPSVKPTPSVRPTPSGTPTPPVTSSPPTTATDAALRVVSYNIKCANCFSGLPNEGTWLERREAVIANLAKQDPDVLGIQEASQAWLKDAQGKTVNLSQFEDLQKGLGAGYRLANGHRNNCVKSTTPTGCVYADQGASKGIKILYRGSRLTLLGQGSRKLSALNPEDPERYVAWAVLQQKSTGKRFFFADAHLEQKKDVEGATGYHELRRTQAQEVIQAINENNSQRLPVISVGDYNSSKWAAPSNAAYDVMLAAGFVDPLGNAYQSTTTAPGATVERRINTHFASFNGYRRVASQRPSFINGSYIDYIFTTPMRVSEYENVVDVDAAGEFRGIIPADHNLQRATVHLP